MGLARFSLNVTDLFKASNNSLRANSNTAKRKVGVAKKS